MKSSLSLIGLLVVIAIAQAAAEDKKPPSKPESPREHMRPVRKLTVRLRDADNKPVAGAHVGTHTEFWPRFFQAERADASGLMFLNQCLSDKEGLAHLESKSGDLLNNWGKIGIVAHHAGRGLIAFALVDASDLKESPVELTLVPECRVSGKIVCPDLAKRGRKVGFVSVSLSIDHTQMMDCRSESDGDFHLLVPPGKYELFAWGTYAPSPSRRQTLTVTPDKREVGLTLTVAAKKFALLRGLPAPELRDIVAWKNSPPLKLSDFAGKCVLLEFWGHWCRPCVGRMPQTFDLYDRYSKQGLVVIGVHTELSSEGVDSVEKLDAKLVSIRKNLWHGRDIPFPVALARPNGEHCAVAEDYGISEWPTMILMDRHGKIVDVMHPNAEGIALLQKALDDKPPLSRP
ncbi:MAG TPA: redoxin domain-containing protein [Planctomycetaceae bacterium]|jgi:thiol-disulfide isomerase/thioredoxin|nr:redoxin domain-containing protein [Planctomycetaceae bacterium]